MKSLSIYIISVTKYYRNEFKKIFLIAYEFGDNYKWSSFNFPTFLMNTIQDQDLPFFPPVSRYWENDLNHS